MLFVVSVLSLEPFMSVSNFSSKTTNNINLSIESTALIDFTLNPNIERIKVSFLITIESVENPTFWYNLVQHIVTSTNDPQVFDTLMSAFRHIPSKQTETVAPINQTATEVLDLQGEVKGTIITSNSIVKVKFKQNIKFEIKEKSVIFQPLVAPNKLSSWQNPEILRDISRQLGKRESLMYSFTFKIPLILKQFILGVLCNISAVTVMPISKGTDIHKISQEVHTEDKIC